MTEKRALNFVCTQNLDPTNWDIPDDKKSNIFSKNPVQTAEKLLHYIYSCLQAKFTAEDEPTQIEFAGILHNKDTDEVWDDLKGDYITESKHDHIHFFIQFQHCTKKYLHAVAECIGIEPQYIESPRGKYGVENSLAYLVHAKDGSKHQYNPADVLTFESMDYQDYYNNHRKDWDYRKSTQSRKNSNIKKDWLIEQIQQGKVTKKQAILDPNYNQIYANNMIQTKEAFTFYSEKQIMKSLTAFEKHKFALTTIFITGNPRVGKTFYAKALIESIIQQVREHYHEQWHVYQTAATNPLDDYSGEQILFLDDVRSNALTATDWLKLMDPINSSPISARYHNKQPASRVILITSYQDPQLFFGFMKGQNPDGESLDQFLGRLSFVTKVFDESDGKRISISNIIHLNTPEPTNITPREIRSNYRDLSFIPQYNPNSFPPDEAIKFLTDKVIDNNDPSKKHVVQEKQRANSTNEEYAKRLTESKEYDSIPELEETQPNSIEMSTDELIKLLGCNPTDTHPM